MSDPCATAAERLIEVTIGLWPDDDPPGKRPPRLAAAIVKALRDEGFTIMQPSEPATAADCPKWGALGHNWLVIKGWLPWRRYHVCTGCFHEERIK